MLCVDFKRLGVEVPSIMIEERLKHCALVYIRGQHVTFDRLQILLMWDSTDRRRKYIALENKRHALIECNSFV